MEYLKHEKTLENKVDYTSLVNGISWNRELKEFLEKFEFII